MACNEVWIQFILVFWMPIHAALCFVLCFYCRVKASWAEQVEQGDDGKSFLLILTISRFSHEKILAFITASHFIYNSSVCFRFNLDSK